MTYLLAYNCGELLSVSLVPRRKSREAITDIIAHNYMKHHPTLLQRNEEGEDVMVVDEEGPKTIIIF